MTEVKMVEQASSPMEECAAVGESVDLANAEVVDDGAQTADGGQHVDDSAVAVDCAKEAADACCIQIVGDDGLFAEGIDKSMTAMIGMDNCDRSYNIVAMLGFQGSGKSTLLNKLFNTQFSAAEGEKSQVATKGIWISRAPGMNALVMDTEGLDSRAHGENSELCRNKVAFAATLADVLVVNLWGHVIDTYNSTMIMLLKQLFETHLRLFEQCRKRRLLFVVRDFSDLVSPNDPATTLTADMEKIWAELPKPSGMEDSSISDHFECTFVTLPHKFYVAEGFSTAVEQLRTRFYEGENPLLDPSTTQQVSAKGLPIYLAAVWDRIVANEDVLFWKQPDTLLESMYSKTIGAGHARFTKEVAQIHCLADEDVADEEFSDKIRENYRKALVTFDFFALQYDSQIREDKRAELKTLCSTSAKSLFRSHLKSISGQLAKEFREKVKTCLEREGQSTEDLCQAVTNIRSAALEMFTSLPQTESWTFSDLQDQLERNISEIETQQRVEWALQQQESVIQQRIQEALQQHKSEIQEMINQALSSSSTY
ncbi:root hair defective 3 GTP-binding protein-domain-containing protein [Thamnocephalis sphaerospora]|uniref:Root hair defective 3 GTP-binding protein-domain-containing protein n=1 Tax=Thamnocephalis sphaerospora TaxID=78915 RepID=A0A4P9XNW7_9FUNG|nr:root hair defective 3 GTP-binding protein-domain-containing protein [Thamnocephalis sphaerospora]|eukprot:RKP07111.1 root hair defective 3 GTP-binding protein-domain-containing protein [Thamnocephalis sphaerospora]